VEGNAARDVRALAAVRGVYLAGRRVASGSANGAVE
jgi:hypothetical protein